MNKATKWIGASFLSLSVFGIAMGMEYQLQPKSSSLFGMMGFTLQISDHWTIDKDSRDSIGNATIRAFNENHSSRVIILYLCAWESMDVDDYVMTKLKSSIGTGEWSSPTCRQMNGLNVSLRKGSFQRPEGGEVSATVACILSQNYTRGMDGLLLVVMHSDSCSKMDIEESEAILRSARHASSKILHD